MKCLQRNKTQFYYCLYDREERPVDEEGFETGEPRVIYSEPVAMTANISPATGNTSTEQFGNDIRYDKVIVTDDTNCPIDEHSVLFVDKTPEYDDDDVPLFDYVVKKVAKSLNSVSIAVSKVEVSA